MTNVSRISFAQSYCGGGTSSEQYPGKDMQQPHDYSIVLPCHPLPVCLVPDQHVFFICSWTSSKHTRIQYVAKGAKLHFVAFYQAEKDV